jgi:hypothetical protein
VVNQSLCHISYSTLPGHGGFLNNKVYKAIKGPRQP